MSVSYKAEEEEIIRRAMSIIGGRTSARKAKSSARNGKRGGRPRGSYKPLAEIACRCGAAADDEHRATCPRGRAYRRRQAASTRSEVKP